MQMCTESSFYRGERYFEEGRVRIKERLQRIESDVVEIKVRMKP